MLFSSVHSAILGLILSCAASLTRAQPTVVLDNATVTGTTLGNTYRFLGIPYAEPPTGDLRFRLPQALPPYSTDFSASTYGPACPQQLVTPYWPSDLPVETLSYLASLSTNNLISAEDCLTLNVIAPAGTTPSSKLPVIAWIYPGGFLFGGSAELDGDPIVEKSISLGVPVVYVSMNHRQNAFGFLASKEVKDAGVGNIGLHDQLLALRWVQKYIGAFGGDPTKVTISGYSSGATSVVLHMLANGGNPDGLFRAAFVEGAGALPVGDITHGQPYYDLLVGETGCSGAHDTLQCLREVPYSILLHAISQAPGYFSYQSLNDAWMPRVDGVFLTANPLLLIQKGNIADVPLVIGNCDDEGTLFSLATLNATTDAEFAEYIGMYYLPNASSAAIAQVAEYYPQDPTQGSPFDTSYLNMITPQFKRLAAFVGDFVFQGPRRFILQNRAGKQGAWTYVNKRLKLVPVLGSFHGADLTDFVNGLGTVPFLVRFAANLDPNIGESMDLYWPKYDTANQGMLEFSDGSMLQSPTTDTYRTEQVAYLMKLACETTL